MSIPETPANQDPSSPERIVSPQILAILFNVAADEMMRKGEGQHLGSYVVAYANQAAIKQHPVRERVTHAHLVSTSAATGPIVTHEVHFPSKDKQVGNFEAGAAIFETHKYDETGNRLDTERIVLDNIDMDGAEIQPFAEQINVL